MNMLRGDLNRLGGCANAISGEEGDEQLSLPRVKPLKYAYEKEIVLYAYHKKLDYFST
jgi:cytoplasmic tRNA 2-thiolation protein 1